jgi:transcriptional regulator with GAF, ATPase, and Fis domain
MSQDRKSAHLIVISPNENVRMVALGSESTTVGSGQDATVTLSDSQLESIHAEVQRSDNTYTLVRHASPLMVNGKRIRSQALEESDLITLGRTAIAFRQGPVPTGAAEQGLTSFGSLDLCERLHRFTEALSQNGPTEALSDQLLADVLALTGADHGRIVRFEGNEPITARGQTRDQGHFSPAEDELSRTAIARILEERKALLWTDTAADPDLAFAPSIVQARASSLICAPIQHGGALLGCLYVSSSTPKNTLGEESLALLTVYANQAALLLAGAQQREELCQEVGKLKEEIEKLAEGRSKVVGASPSIESLLRDVGKVSGFDLSILLLGETGVGKGFFANQLHDRSNRHKGPLISVHCGAIPDKLLESELFGHVKGAFTDAASSRTGKIVQANSGTLFLDEIGEMPLEHQVKLLKVLEDRAVTPVGAERSIPVDFRLVCATNRDLQADVEAGLFRRDLYYRIAGVVLSIPPLRDRQDDAIELAHYYLRLHGAALGRTELFFSAAALTAIRQHEWPGNVREVELSVKRAIALADAEMLTPTDLGLLAPEGVEEISEGGIVPFAQARDDFLKKYINEVVASLDGNRSAAAEALQVTPRTIYKYIEEL